MRHTVVHRGIAIAVLTGSILCRAQAAQGVEDADGPELDKPYLRDKLLGMLVGSAIGDAMGAPTEMWERDRIEAEYGFVRGLHPHVRETSPEGVWTLNPPAGATTDDTRWKELTVAYLAGERGRGKPRASELRPEEFAGFIVRRFSAEIERLGGAQSPDAQAYHEASMRLAWLQEWVRVAEAYRGGDITAYSDALNRFYGGEMVCAGLLFSPVLGAYYPGDPERAYRETFAIDLYDLGFAKDVSAITAAMVAAAMAPEATAESILEVLREVDPRGYFESRLVGRIAYTLYQDALVIVLEAKKAKPKDEERERGGWTGPPGAAPPPAPLERARIDEAYRRLTKLNQRMAFHAGEIHLVNLTALLFSDFDFRRAMEFVVNYGRDNDTTAAVTGAILGAYLGAGELPEDWVAETLDANRKLGIDLEELADRMTDAIVNR